MSDLGVLVIGCGAIAGGYDAARADDALPRSHAPAYRQAGGFTLLGCVDPDPSRRAAFQERWNVARSAATIAEIADAGPFDIISICSPTALHEAHLAEALALKPRAVFLEKPVSPTLVTSARMVDAADSAGVSLAVNHTRRWAPDVQALAADLAEGRYGAVRSASACYTKGVLNNGSHLFDLLHMLLGPLRVMAVGRPIPDHDPLDPSIPCLLESSAEVPVVVNVGNAADFAFFELEVVTQSACISMEDGGMRWRTRWSVDSPAFPGYRALDAGVLQPGRYEEAMLAAVSQLRRHLLNGESLACTGRHALDAQGVSNTIRVAAGLPAS